MCTTAPYALCVRGFLKTKVMKALTTRELIDSFNKLSAPKKVTILYGALDYMEQYNGRSKERCLCLAMGYQEADNGCWYKKEQ